MTAGEGDDANRLGREVGWRLRRPGRPRGGLRTTTIGAVSEHSTRFAAALARPAVVRRALATPSVARVGSTGGVTARPPRWWYPATPGEQEPLPSIAPEKLPARGLPRAARQIPNEQTWTPGGIAESLKSAEIRVRRYAEVSAAGNLSPVPKLNSAPVQAGAARAAQQRAAEAAAASAQPVRRTSTPAPAPPPPGTAPPAAPAGASTPVSPTAPTASAPHVTPPGGSSGLSPTGGPAPMTSAAAPLPQPGGGPAWRPAPRSFRFAAATGSAAAVLDTPPGAAVRRSAVDRTPGRTAVLERALDPHLTASSSGPAVGIAPAGARPLRRMVGAPHALRPASRAATATARPPAGPIPARTDQPEDAVRGGTAAPATVRRMPAGRTAGTPVTTAAPTAPSSSSTASPAASPAASPTAPAGSPASGTASPAAAAPSTAPTSAQSPAPTGTPAATPAPPPAATVGGPTAGSAGAAAPAPGSTTAAGTGTGSARPTGAAPDAAPSARPERGAVVIPLRRTAATPATEEAPSPLPVRRMPSGLGLASVRSLRTLTGPATDLRPATRAAALLPNPGGRIPSLPAAIRRQPAEAATGDPAATVVRRSVRTPASGAADAAGASAPIARQAVTAPAPAAPAATAPAGPRTAATAPAAAVPPSPTAARPAGPPFGPAPAGPPSPTSRATPAPAVSAGQRLAAIAMPDQLAVRRRAIHGAREAATGAALGSGFGAVETIRPATVAAGLAPGFAGSGLQPIRPRSVVLPAAADAPPVPASARTAPAASRSASPAVRRSMAPSAGSSSAPSGSVPAAVQGSAGVAAPAPAVPAVGSAGTAAAAFAGTPLAATAFAQALAAPPGASRPLPGRPATTGGVFAATDAPTGAILRRNYVVAPPPVSLAPARRTEAAPPSPAAPGKEIRRASATAAPPATAVSAAATQAATPATAAGGDRSAIFQAAQQLFRSFADPAAPQRGGDMSENLPAIRRLVDADPAPSNRPLPPIPTRADAVRRPVGPTVPALSPQQMDELVDEVVDRIEQRVIDELERRGRFGPAGGM